MSDTDFQIFDVENEPEKRRNDQRPEIGPTASKSKIGIFRQKPVFSTGMIIFRIFGKLRLCV
ncbi:MAG TPA: hypothetical protein VK308_02345 [Pyrinomonadaceae bacterium]|nr:hypothetical protein [Pyrinomonadaceae bacterium]